ncbi:MAG: glutathione peroxidase, partial [Maribacter sp.]
MKTVDKAKLAPSTSTETKSQSIYDIAINAIDGTTISLLEFKGKKILFVNVASKCGFTKQY